MKTIVNLSGIAIVIAVAGCKPGYKNDPAPHPVPVVYTISVTPTSFLPNSAVSIKGDYFSTVKAENKISFNGAEATIDSVISPTEILVSVPENATSGNVKVTSNNKSAVTPYKILTGTVSPVFGPGDEANVLTTDDDGNLYGANYDRVYKIDTKGVKTMLYQELYPNPSGLRTKFIRGIAVDHNGNLYISQNQTTKYLDIFTSRIFKITPEGIKTTFFDTDGIVPNQMVADTDNSLFVTDNNKHIIRITPDGKATKVCDVGCGVITFGPDGNLLISSNYTINSVSKTGVVKILAGNGTYGSVNDIGKKAGFAITKGIAADKDGNIFIAELNSENSATVRMINKLGLVTTLIKYKNEHVTGPLNNVTMPKPTALTIDNNGNLYVANYTFNVYLYYLDKISFK